jgi:anti-anti-sigma factor
MAESDESGLLEHEEHGDVTVVRIKEPMLRGDAATEDLFTNLYALVEDGGHHKLVLNLGAVVYLASAALGRLVTLYHKARAAGTRLALCEVTPTVDHLLRLSRLADLMLVYGDERKAIGSFA